MIISHRHKYLFVEVPHTASSAVSRELTEHYAGESTLYKHANYSEFRRIASRSEKRYFVFAGVRNPLDTAITEYSKLKSNHWGDYTDPKRYAVNDGWIPESHLEKFRFIRDNEADFAAFFRRFYDEVYHQWVMTAHHRYDFVMRFERIQEDFGRVLEKLGLQQLRPLPVVNESKRSGAVADYYKPELRAQAVRVFGPFMRKWEYEFPDDWGDPQTPLVSRLRFGVSEALVNALARFARLSPYDPFVQRCKQLARRVGAA